MPDTWYYKDPRGEEHGPFTEDNMRKWFNQNYFEPTLLIRKKHDTDFTPLHQADPAFTKPVPLPSKEKPAQKVVKPEPVAIEEVVVQEAKPAAVPVVTTQASKKRKLDDTGFVEPIAKKPKPKEIPKPVPGAEEQWIYLDNSKNIQGPFPTSTMRSWWETGALHDTLPIKLYIPGLTSLTDKSLFVALKEYPRCSFTLPPEVRKQEALQAAAATKAKKVAKRKKLKPPKKWYYRDPEGTERGPFTLVLMRQWFSKQYIPLDTPVRAENVKGYIPIHTKTQIFEDKETANDRKNKQQSLWTFIDDEGRIQGPFEKFVLKSWHEFGWLPYDIRVRRVGETYYIPWGDRIKTFLEDDDDENEVSAKQNEAELSKLRPKANEDKWYYKDDSGGIQGPFTADAMRGWFEEGFFVSHTEVRKGEESGFMPMRQCNPPPPWIAGLRFPDEPMVHMHPHPHPMMMGMPPHPMMMGMPPPESMWFYMAAGDKAVGPYPLSQIQTWHREGYFNDRVKVSHAETPDQWKLIVDTECAWKPHLHPQHPPHPMANPMHFNRMMAFNPRMMVNHSQQANPAAPNRPGPIPNQTSQAQMTAAINNLTATINSAPAVQLPQMNSSAAMPQMKNAQMPQQNVAPANPAMVPIQANPAANPGLKPLVSIAPNSLQANLQPKPGLQPQPNPVVQVQSNPYLQPLPNPGMMQMQANPGMQPHANLGMQPHSNPGMQPQVNPSMQPKPSPGIQPHQNLAMQLQPQPNRMQAMLNPGIPPQQNLVMQPQMNPQLMVRNPVMNVPQPNLPKVNSSASAAPQQLHTSDQAQQAIQILRQQMPNFVPAQSVPQMNPSTQASLQIMQQLQAATQRVMNNPTNAGLQLQNASLQRSVQTLGAAPTAAPAAPAAPTPQHQPPNQEQFLE